MKKLTNKICISAVIASLYTVLTVLLAPIGYGPLQLRVAEALTILPVLMPFSVWGLFAGCLISNIFMSPYGIFDIVIGSLTTLIAGLLTTRTKNVWLGGLPPIVLNAFFLPFIWILLDIDYLYWYNVLSLLASQTFVVYGLGVPLHFVCKKNLLPLIEKDNMK